MAAAVTFALVLAATRGEARPTTTAAATSPSPSATGPAGTRGRAVFAAMGCGSCHRLAAAGSQGQIGPPLDQVLPRHTRESLRAKITNPGAASIMPRDFARRLTAGDLDALLDFLVASRDAAR
jgi:mono/diheme cytochrome c family protein